MPVFFEFIIDKKFDITAKKSDVTAIKTRYIRWVLIAYLYTQGKRVNFTDIASQPLFCYMYRMLL